MLNKIYFYLLCTLLSTYSYAQQKIEQKDTKITIRNGEKLHIERSLIDNSNTIIFKVDNNIIGEFDKDILFSAPDTESYFEISFFDDEDKLSNYAYSNEEQNYKFLKLSHNNIIVVEDSNKNKIATIHYKNKSKAKEEKANEDKKTTIERISDNANVAQPKVKKESINISKKFDKGENILADAKFLLDPDQEISDKTTMLKMYNISNTNSAFFKHFNFPILNDDPGRYNPSNIAKTDVTNFATGMARFLADRAKQELNETFFLQMHKQMNRVKELQIYFPESYVFLNSLDAHSISFELDHMRARFNQDINQLPKNFYNSTQKNNHLASSHLYTINNYLKNDPKGQWVDYGLQVVFENNGKINPKELIHNFVHSDARKNLEQKLTNETDKNLLNTIKLAELISSSLLSPDPNRYWVTQDEINNLLSDEKLFQTYIGLLLAKSSFTEYDIKFSGDNLKEIIEHKYTYSDKVQDLKNLKNFVKTLYNSYAQVDNAVSEIAENKGNFNTDNLYQIYNVLNDNISTITTQVNNNNILSSKIQINDSYFKNYIKPTVDIAYNMSSKKYGVAIKGLVQLLENSVNIKQIDLIKNVTNNLGDIENLNGGQLAKSLLIQYLTTGDNFKKLQPLLGQNTPKYFEYLTDASKINELKLFYDFVNEVNLNKSDAFTELISSNSLSFDSTIQEIKKFKLCNDLINNLSSDNKNTTAILQTIINNSKLKNIDELQKIISNNKTTNIDELQKIISDYKTANIIGTIDNSEIFQNVLKFTNKLDDNKFKSLNAFINNNKAEIEQLLFVAQHYKFEDLKTKNLEAIARSYFEDAESLKAVLRTVQSSNDFKKHVKRYGKNYNNFLSKFTTYGVLIANVATAQNSDEVKAAIEASVLPVGSSRMKRNSNWSITANAYVGAFYGNAFYKELVNGTLEKRSIASFGITAPMGISFSKGNLKVFNQNTSLGINLQLIDLGSLVNFYMKEGDGASLPRDTQIKLGDIIAPGGSLSYSIGDSPFTLLGGVQYVPNLNRMESIPTNSDFKPVAWRVHFGLAIDIPLFNIKIWN